ncbi:ACT domain-containing protein [Enterococcus quebecensis]|uniref:ACT domain-containing protein n=1 Tax=Enterococcus quebecensis TaxID=903983 RepID=A0A1E5GRA5_9ENTE|nr:ACT domain-containing protein [Enterococcus quebecensis]OEG15212.1 ACT domain-containing protein [Enterococcus quebecensis]OJG74793.1 hypothetical protein RV12_GL002210 [Enterococcus quebecensis]
MQLKLWDDTTYTIMKFPAHVEIPTSFHEILGFKSIAYTKDECSIIVPTNTLPTEQALSVDNNWFIIQIAGELDFSLVGILTQLANPLAENQISIFALSTYNTDYLLIKNKDKDKAIHVLKNCGHTF